jgi:hypothetical protein
MTKSGAGLVLTATLIAIGSPWGAFAAGRLVTVRMSVDEDPIVLRLGESLGYFRQEGLTVVRVDLERLGMHDYLIQEPLMKGQLDASYHGSTTRSSARAMAFRSRR